MSEQVPWQQRWMRRFYPRDRGWRDGTQGLHALCAASIPKGGSILEIGCGPGNPTSRHLATLGELHGLDPDPQAQSNESLASFARLEGARFPYEDATFDACVSNFVLEHVEHPESHLAEVRRVLRPGGALILRTPNRWHYVALVSAWTPHAFHVAVANRLRALPRDAHDPYPTFYRLNSRGRIRRLAAAAGLRVESLRIIEKEPSYGMSSRLLFAAFLAYERVVNAHPAFEGLRATLLGVLRRD